MALSVVSATGPAGQILRWVGGGGGVKRKRKRELPGETWGMPPRKILNLSRLKWAENASKILVIVCQMTQCI